MSRKDSVLIALAFCCFAMMTFDAQAQGSNNNWFVQTDLQGLVGSFSGTTQRDTLQNVGVFIRADYLDSGGVTFGYNQTVLGFQDGSPDIEQDNFFFSGRVKMTPDWGQVTLRLDAHTISNNDLTNETDDVTVIYPQVSYLNYAQTFYLDIGYSASSYGNSLLTSTSLDIDQLTPTIGFGFNEQNDWLQFRTYLIDSSNAQRSQNTKDTTALELKWTHWMTGHGFLGLDNFRASVLVGERIFAVDPDAGGVYNLVDLQTGGASIGGEWAPSERNQILLMLGVEQYENETIGDDYDSAFIYLNFTHQWD